MEITNEMVSKGQRALGMAMMKSGYSGIPIDPLWVREALRAGLEEGMAGDLLVRNTMRFMANNIRDLVKELRHAVQWHDQLSSEDIKRYEALLEEVDPK